MIAKKIPLDYPFEFGGEKVTELNMRRSTCMEHIYNQEMDGSEIEMQHELFGNLCEVDPELFEEMDEADINQCQQAYEKMLESINQPTQDGDITLDYPHTSDKDGTATVTDTISMRRSKGRDRMENDALTVSIPRKEVFLLARLTHTSFELLSSLYMSDYLQVKDRYKSNIKLKKPKSKSSH